MTTLTIFSFLFNIVLIALGAYAIYREKDLIKFERKIWKYIKAFFKALYYTLTRKNPDVKASVEPVLKEDYSKDYEQMLAGLNKFTEFDDVLVA